MDFGDLVLVIGDYHIPTRSTDLPECFKELLQTDKIKTVLCTGNLGGKTMLNEVEQLGQEVHIVRGETDDKHVLGRELSDSVIVEIGGFRVGLINGYQIVPWDDESMLMHWQRKMDCDILISGHTHQARYFTQNGKLFLNPGSVTGASNSYIGDQNWNKRDYGKMTAAKKKADEKAAAAAGDGEADEAPKAEEPIEEQDPESMSSVLPSFMLMAVQGNRVVVYVYKDKNGEIDIDQVEHQKM